MSFERKNGIEVCLEELIYENAGYVIKELMKREPYHQYNSGKITGYLSDNDYKVLLEDGRLWVEGNGTWYGKGKNFGRNIKFLTINGRKLFTRDVECGRII